MANNTQMGITIRAVDQFSGVFRKLGASVGDVKKSLGTISTMMGTLGLGYGAAQMTHQLITIAQESISLGVEIDGLRAAYDSLTRTVNVNGNAMLASMKRASQGMISEIDTIKSANLALVSGNQELIAALPKIMEVSVAAARATGQSVDYIYESLVKGILRASPLLIDNAGIIMKIGPAMDAYAKSLGKTVDELDDASRTTAVLRAVMGEADDYIASVGDTANTAAGKMAVLETSIKDLKTAIGSLVTDTGIIDWLGETGYAINFYIGAVKLHQEAIADMTSGGVQGMVAAAAKESEFLRLQSLLATDAKAAAEGMNELTGGFGGVAAAGPGAAAAVDGVTDAVDGLNRALGKWGANQYATAIYGGVVNQPSETMAGGQHPSQYGYGKNIAQQQQVVTDHLDRQAESERRKGEYARLYNEQLREEQALLDGIRSRAESVLMAGGTGVSQQDMLDTEAGRYQDKPLEAARRLADIANQGMASPWAKILVPPAEVIAQGEAAVKAWASRTQQEVLDLTRPDLVNWDAFIANYKAALDRETGKENTLNIAMQKLGEAGLLSGVDPEQAKATVAQMFGLDTPATQAESFATGFAEALGQKDLANLFLGSFDADVSENKDTIKKSGANLGRVIIDGVNTGVRDNVGSVRKTIAYYVAPEVAAILEAKDGAKP